MLKKSIVLFLFASLCLSQAFIFRTPTTVANVEMTELVSMLPDSDVAVMFDVERTLSVAAPEMLNNDQKKIENLKKMLASVENQIGINPEEIRHIALGLKIPLTGKVPGKFEDFLTQSQFTAIVRTKNSNAAFFDTWTKRLDVIMAFKEDQAPAQKYMNAFKAFRDFKMYAGTPEKIADATGKFQAALAKSQAIEKRLNAIPKTVRNRQALNDLIQKNKSTMTTISDYLNLLKTDGNLKTFNENSIKLLNRYNNIGVDDPQKTAKLNAVLQDSKTLYPEFYKKYQNAQKLEMFFMQSAEPEGPTDANIFFQLDEKLNKINESLDAKPASYDEADMAYDGLKEAMSLNLNPSGAEGESDPYSPEKMNAPKPVASIDTKPKALNETLKLAQREVTVNNKKMLVIDFNKFDEPEKTVITDAKVQSTATGEPATEQKKPETPNFGIGFLDDHTFVIGLESGVTQFLQRDASYKNEKAIEMLASSKNPLMAFAVNSNIAKAISAAEATGAAKPPLPVSDTIFTRLFNDVNIYGSINYDGANVTNDLTMSLGMFKDQTGNLTPPPAADNSDQADKTFQFGDSLISSGIFYDLLNSFKAVQASLTFKFDKKKVARLVRAAPRIAGGLMAKEENQKPANAQAQSKATKQKANKLDTLEDLLTAPEVYLNLARLFSNQES